MAVLDGRLCPGSQCILLFRGWGGWGGVGWGGGGGGGIAFQIGESLGIYSFFLTQTPKPSATKYEDCKPKTLLA